MIRQTLFFTSLFALSACREPFSVKEGEAPDTAPVEEDPDEGYTSCEKVSLDILGPEYPVVGDQWLIWLDCDGARLSGPMVIRFDPVDMATVDENEATFLYAGSGIMYVDSGADDLKREFTVSE